MLLELKSESVEEAELIYYAIRKALILKKSNYKVKAYALKSGTVEFNQFSVIPGISTSSVQAMATLESAVFSYSGASPITINVTVDKLPFKVSDIDTQGVKGIGDDIIFEGVGNPSLQMILIIDRASHINKNDDALSIPSDFTASSWFAPEYVETSMEYDENSKIVRIKAEAKHGNLESDMAGVRNFFLNLGGSL